MSEHCDDRGPELERCLLEPAHRGWHKSHRVAWPNTADTLEKWAAIGRRLMHESVPGLSLREMEYALDAVRRERAG